MIDLLLWRNWERENRPYRFHTLAHFWRELIVCKKDSRIDPYVIPPYIRQHSTTVLLISIECIEWHASDRLRRQFSLTQGIPHQERDLGEAHGKVLIGPKNQDWSGTHSFWVMHWTNQYSHVLVEHMVPSQHQLDIYLHWYRGTYGDHLHLSDLKPQENQDGDPMQNQENQQVQPPPPQPPSPPQPQAQQEPEQFTPYIPETHSADYFTPPVHQQYWSVLHQESGE
ncbi:hypothetical protein Ahy_A03g010982 [Arachis hypogaea]|uniref:Uncharacterized protein n=1 Tax=Arachis hypogaea TaxID=3818 RepID=A0A445DP68_ARAHY|nr:hypothetical protein Ahy_A03g010982 [Arachis hypogaea]